MFRALLRLVLIVVVIAAAAAFFMGYRIGDHRNDTTSERPIATTGTSPSDEETSISSSTPRGSVTTDLRINNAVAFRTLPSRPAHRAG